MANNFTEQEIRAIVRDEIRVMAGAAPSQDIKYLPTEEAYKLLGYSTSAQLRYAVKNGTFREGKEYQDRRSNGSEYSRYFFNIPACEKRLNTSPENRGVC